MEMSLEVRPPPATKCVRGGGGSYATKDLNTYSLRPISKMTLACYVMSSKKLDLRPD